MEGLYHMCPSMSVIPWENSEAGVEKESCTASVGKRETKQIQKNKKEALISLIWNVVSKNCQYFTERKENKQKKEQSR